MANLLDKYGIKEVADVMFYDLDSNGNVDYSSPVLYLDTLKVSTIEQTAENVSARGGKGNPELVTWDYNKEINVTLEDALFSAKSMAMMFGTQVTPSNQTITRAVPVGELKDNSVWRPNDKRQITYNSVTYIDGNGSTTDSTSNAKYAIISFTPVDSYVITIDSNKFPGTYAVIGETYARSEATGDDEFFQFMIHKAKVTSEVTFTLEAEGDPTTFNMSLKVLRPSTGNTMMSLTKYNLNDADPVTGNTTAYGKTYTVANPQPTSDNFGTGTYFTKDDNDNFSKATTFSGTATYYVTQS